MDGDGVDADAIARPASDVLCGTLFLLPGAQALGATLGEGA